MSTVNIIIPCSGFGSRIQDIMPSIFPKVLLRYNDTQTIFDHIVETSDVSANLYFVCNSMSHIEMLKERLLQRTNTRREIYFVYHPIADGSYNAVKSAVTEYSLKSFVALWCDIAVDMSGVNALTKQANGLALGILNAQYSGCRWQFDFKGLREVDDASGNVFGLYSVSQDYIQEFLDFECYDVVEFFDSYKVKEISYQFFDVTDLGDADKYKKHCDNQPKASKGRWFNDLEVNDSVLLKTSNSRFGVAAIKNEAIFYIQHIQEGTVSEDLFPKWLGSKTFSREVKIEWLENAVTLHEHRCMAALPIDAVNELFDKLHSSELPKHPPSEEEYRAAIMQEYVGKTRQRIMLSKSFVNNLPTLMKNMSIAGKLINELPYPTMSMIHADPNAENILVKEDGTLIFIDPKGNFGGLSGVGDPMYDYVKLVYGLVFFNDLDNYAKTGMFRLPNNYRTTEMIFYEMLSLARQSFGFKDKETLNRFALIFALVTLSVPMVFMHDVNKMQYAMNTGEIFLELALKGFDNA